MINPSKEELEELARKIRLDIVEMNHNSGFKGAHLGGSLSIADIMAVLYGCVMNVDPQKPDMEERDRLLISKAHAAMAWYAALHQRGFISDELIASAMHGDSDLYEHPCKSPELGIESSGGSLGMGLSFGMGMALGLKKKGNNKSRVFVIIGDGECDEGSVWEAANSVVNYHLENLLVIIDQNHLQFDGLPEDVMKIGSMKARWESVGFAIEEVNGHDVMALYEALSRKREHPTVLICETVKGKGVSYAENKVEWHSKEMTDDLYKIALEELGEIGE